MKNITLQKAIQMINVSSVVIKNKCKMAHAVARYFADHVSLNASLDFLVKIVTVLSKKLLLLDQDTSISLKNEKKKYFK